MIQVDGRLKKIVESLNKSDYHISFAKCVEYTNSDICEVEILIGFASAYDRFLFEDLPEHFEFISDKYHPRNYTLTYILNYVNRPMSMIIFDYYNHSSKSEPSQVMLKEAINSLYDWAKKIEGSGKWAVYKLGGYL